MFPRDAQCADKRDLHRRRLWVTEETQQAAWPCLASQACLPQGQVDMARESDSVHGGGALGGPTKRPPARGPRCQVRALDRSGHQTLVEPCSISPTPNSHPQAQPACPCCRRRRPGDRPRRRCPRLRSHRRPRSGPRCSHMRLTHLRARLHLQVPGCTNSMAGLPLFYKRVRICGEPRGFQSCRPRAPQVVALLACNLQTWEAPPCERGQFGSCGA